MCHNLKKQNVSSRVSLFFKLMDIYPRSSSSLDQDWKEFFLARLKYIDCINQYKSSSVLNETLSEQYFLWQTKSCENYLILWCLVIYFKQLKYKTSTSKRKTIIILIIIITIIKEYKRRPPLVLKTKWEKQNNSNNCMGSGCNQIRSRNTTVKREWIKRCGQEIKENNDNVWSVTPEERCGQIVHKEERGMFMFMFRYSLFWFGVK